MANLDRQFHPFHGNSYRLRRDGSVSSAMVPFAPGSSTDRSSSTRSSTGSALTQLVLQLGTAIDLSAFDDALTPQHLVSEDVEQSEVYNQVVHPLTDMRDVVASWLYRVPDHGYTVELRSDLDTFVVKAM